MCVAMAEFFSAPAHIIYQCVHTSVSMSERIPLCVSYTISDREGERGKNSPGTFAKISVSDTVKNMDTQEYCI